MSEKITLEQLLPVAATVFATVSENIFKGTVSGYNGKQTVIDRARLFAEFTLEMQKTLNTDK